MRMKYSNATLLFFATFLFGYAVFSSSPAELLKSAQSMLAAVGVSASVEPNQYNTVAEQLAAKEARLNQQASDLAAKEKADAQSPANLYGFWSLCISAALFALIAFNFYMDSRRRGLRGGGKLSVDLR